MKKLILFLILISNQLLIAQNTPWDEETPPISLECTNGDVFEISILDLFSNPVVLDSINSLCGEEGIDEDWNRWEKGPFTVSPKFKYRTSR